MNEIICPNCHKAFKIDEAGFADILKQVKDHQFEEELQKREGLLRAEKESAVKLAEEQVKNKIDVITNWSLDNPLLKFENAVLTPHMAFLADESLKNMADIIVENVESFVKGKAKNVVNS